MIVLSLVPAWGAQWAYVAWALWMVQSIVSLLTCIGLPFLQFTRHELAFSTMAGTWLLPIVAPVVSAASGSVVASVLPPAHARFTLIVAYILWGTAVPTSLLVFGILWARLAIHKIPPGSLSVSAFLPVGPCGLGGFSIMNLAAVQRHLALRGEAALGGASLYDAREQLMFADAVYAGVSGVDGAPLCVVADASGAVDCAGTDHVGLRLCLAHAGNRERGACRWSESTLACADHAAVRHGIHRGRPGLQYG
jgi:hypothetical protein